MKITLYVLGGLLDLIGSVWFLQGINILPGSFMTGDIHWAIYGAITAMVGGLVVLAGSRRQKPQKG